MTPSLTADEERLFELLEAMGAVDPAKLQEGVDTLLEARGRGEDVDLGPYLVGRGLVSVSLLAELLSDAAEQTVAGRAAERPDGEFAGDETDPFARADRKPPQEKGREAGPLPRTSARSRKETGRERRPSRRTSARRATSGRAGARSARRSARAPARASGRAPAGASGRAEEAAPAPDEESDLSEVQTRRFDLDALAAASAKPRRSRKAVLAPAALAGLGLAITLGLIGFAGLFGGGAPEPDPTPPEVQPDAHDALADLLSEPDGSAGTDVAALIERARSLAALEAFDSALELFRTLGPKERADPDVIRCEQDLTGLRRLAEDGQRLLTQLGDLTVEGQRTAEASRQREEVLERIEALLATAEELPPARIVRRLRRALLEAVVVPEAPPKALELPGNGAPSEPSERTARFRALASEGTKAVRAVKAKIAAQQAAAERAHAEEAARARAASQRAPLTVSLKGFVLRDAVVEALDQRGFVLTAQGNRAQFAWDAVVDVDPELALKIRKLAVRDDSPPDHLRLGYWCLEQRQFEAARRAFAQAVVLDARLTDRIPDVGAIARSSRVLNGRVERRAGSSALEISYDFVRPSEGHDWELRGEARGGVSSDAGHLEVTGKGFYLAELAEVGFERWLQVEAELGPGTRGLAAVGVTFRPAGGGIVALLAALDPDGEVLMIRRVRGKTHVVARRKIPPATRLGLEIRDGVAWARLGGRAVLEADLGLPWERPRVVVGGASSLAGVARFGEVEVRGQVRQAWLRKAFGEFDALLRSSAARTDDLDLFARPSDRPAPAPLSAEDAFGLRGVPEDALREYRAARERSATGRPLDRLAAVKAYGRAIEQAPRFAAALFRRGLVLEDLGRPRLAVADLEAAEKACPHFYEAASERARILATLGLQFEARAAAKLALAIRPDHAPALAARALIAFERGDLEDAQEDLDVALALAPWDEGIRGFRGNVRHVVDGPPWEQTYVHETAHYQVKTDIGQARCAEYAADLEAIRTFYVKVFGEPPKAARARKASVLIFDTREGFHAYAELTTDDRVESLLGYYLPRYRQLLLYEDKDDADLHETRRVLFHEAFHQFMGGVIADLPYWLSEGFADYFSSAQVEGGKVSGQGEPLRGRLQDVRRMLEGRGRPIPFPDLIQETPSEFYSGDVAGKYAQAWSMIHFFLHGAPADVRERLRRYVVLLRKGRGPRRAFEQAWGGVDWTALQRAWAAHVRGL